MFIMVSYLSLFPHCLIHSVLSLHFTKGDAAIESGCQLKQPSFPSPFFRLLSTTAADHQGLISAMKHAGKVQEVGRAIIANMRRTEAQDGMFCQSLMRVRGRKNKLLAGIRMWQFSFETCMLSSCSFWILANFESDVHSKCRCEVH